MIGQEDPQRAGLVGVVRPCVSRVGVSCGHCARPATLLCLSIGVVL